MSTWRKGDTVIEEGRRYLCLLSGDVPKETNGQPKVSWLKLGHDDGGGYNPGNPFVYYDQRGYFGREPTVPADISNVRVVVHEEEYRKVVPVQGTFRVPGGRVIEDWPCTCPRCGTPKSAVLLFSSWDCKRGCFTRGGAQ